MSAAGLMVVGGGLVSGKNNSYNDFTVYTKGTGLHGLYVNVEGPSRVDLQYTDNHDGTVKVSYLPRLPGDYKVFIKYDGRNVIGSPFLVHIRQDELSRQYVSPFLTTKRNARGESMPVSMVRRVKVCGRGIRTGITNVNNEIAVHVLDAGPGKLRWSFEGPGDVVTHTRGLENGVYRIYYRPNTPGEYTLRMSYSSQDVIGSPFKVSVV